MFSNPFKKKQKPRFVTQELYEKNLERQLTTNKLIVQRLTELGVREGQTILLDFSFYAIDLPNLKLLEQTLQEMNYTELQIKNSSHNQTEFYLLRGKTTPIEFGENSINEWVKDMIAIGFKYDCEFDGWGTNTN